MREIYLDCASTTPMDPRVKTAMEPYFDMVFGNPSTLYRQGRLAKDALDHSRESVAKIFGARPDEIVFTAGGTEADNIAIFGVAAMFAPLAARANGAAAAIGSLPLTGFREKKGHLITTAIEHHAALRSFEALGREGWRVTFVPVDAQEKIVNRISENLKTTVVRVSIGESNLLGMYAAMNSNGIVLPNVATPAEISIIKETGLNVYVSKDKNNAFGNNLLLNDKGALINYNIDKAEIKNMEDTLGVEVLEGKIAGYCTVGSACIANNNGFLAHFNTSEAELADIKNGLKVSGLKGSINMGVGFISYGVIHNKNSYLAGERSSAFELGRVEEALGYIK